MALNEPAIYDISKLSFTLVVPTHLLMLIVTRREAPASSYLTSV